MCVGPFLFILFFKSGIDKLTEWSMMPTCPSPMCFFNRGSTEGTNSSKKIVFDICVLFYVYLSGLILCFSGNLWFNDLCVE